VLSLWNTVSPYQVQLWSLATVLFATTVNRFARLRPRIYYSIHHSSSILVNEPRLDAKGSILSPNQIVHMASIVVENGGISTAKALEIAFAFKPKIMNVSPRRAYSESTSPLGGHSIKFDSIAPSEQTKIDIMSINEDLPILTAVRSDECQGKYIMMAPQRIWPSWFTRSIGVVLLIGAISSVYLLIRLIQTIAY